VILNLRVPSGTPYDTTIHPRSVSGEPAPATAVQGHQAQPPGGFTGARVAQGQGPLGVSFLLVQVRSAQKIDPPSQLHAPRCVVS
jgi:hypothetical protein